MRRYLALAASLALLTVAACDTVGKGKGKAPPPAPMAPIVTKG
jgi:hypothetical protein